jgi:hypothetical protein
MGRKKLEISSRTCINCNITKNADNFRGRKTCKDCENIKQIEYRENNIDKVRLLKKDWRIKNKEKIKITDKNWYQNNKEKANKKQSIYVKNRRKKDILYKLTGTMRSMLRRCLINKKTDRTSKILGYTSKQLKARIECQFKDGMSWDNYGEWQIDHKKSISLFPPTTPINLINALSNLQPMWKIDNLLKGNRWLG